MQQYTFNVANLGLVDVNDYTSNLASENFGQPFAGTQVNYLQQQEMGDFKKDIQNKFSQFKPNTTEPKKEKKMALAKNKRGLFQVILVDPKEKKVLLNTMVIADSIEDVLLEVDAGKIIKEANLSVSDVDKIVNVIGQIRKTRKNKTGEVEILNDEEVKD